MCRDLALGSFVNLCVLLLCGCIVVTPSHFHFTIIALTVDQDRAFKDFHRLTCRTEASYNSATFKDTDLITTTILLLSSMIICLRCPQTFGHSVVKTTS